jgi:hypothetical protein
VVGPDDPRAKVGESRRAVGRHDFAEVARHTSVLYVLSGQYGPDDAAENAHRMMRLGCALLDAGGIAVKCESSGKAHSAKMWRCFRDLADQGMAMLRGDQKDNARWRFWLALRRAYVFSPLLSKNGDLYTLGMHLLGRRDAITPRGDDDRAGDELLTEFSEYVLAECADDPPREGEKFRTGPEAPRWRISTEPCHGYEEDDFFFNPYGYFRLQPAADDAPAAGS